jgi:hypothetical protein
MNTRVESRTFNALWNSDFPKFFQFETIFCAVINLLLSNLVEQLLACEALVEKSLVFHDEALFRLSFLYKRIVIDMTDVTDHDWWSLECH